MPWESITGLTAVIGIGLYLRSAWLENTTHNKQSRRVTSKQPADGNRIDKSEHNEN